MSNFVEIAKQYAVLTHRKKALREEADNIATEAHKLVPSLLEAREREGIGDKVDFEEFGLMVFNDDKLSSKLVDKDAFSEWIEENDLTSLGKWNIHHSKRTTLCKERHEAGEAPPAGCEVTIYTDVSMK